MTPDAEFNSHEGSVRGVRFGAVFALYFKIPMKAACIEELREWQGSQMPDEPIGSLSIVFDARRVESDVNEATDRYMKEFAPRTRASAVIISADGFAASAARAMISTFFLVNRVSCPRKVFANAGTAAQWVAGYFDDPADVERAEAWLQELERTERPASAAPT